jgi:hypothetical protein
MEEGRSGLYETNIRVQTKKRDLGRPLKEMGSNIVNIWNRNARRDLTNGTKGISR